MKTAYKISLKPQVQTYLIKETPNDAFLTAFAEVAATSVRRDFDREPKEQDIFSPQLKSIFYISAHFVDVFNDLMNIKGALCWVKENNPEYGHNVQLMRAILYPLVKGLPQEFEYFLKYIYAPEEIELTKKELDIFLRVAEHFIDKPTRAHVVLSVLFLRTMTEISGEDIDLTDQLPMIKTSHRFQDFLAAVFTYPAE